MTLEDLLAEQRAAAAELAVLTPRERELLVLVCKGYTNKGIGDALGLSPKTVELHRSNGLRSLEMCTAEAIVTATRARWV